MDSLRKCFRAKTESRDELDESFTANERQLSLIEFDSEMILVSEQLVSISGFTFYALFRCMRVV
jgi:hypothetical protein